MFGDTWVLLVSVPNAYFAWVYLLVSFLTLGGENDLTLELKLRIITGAASDRVWLLWAVLSVSGSCHLH